MAKKRVLVQWIGHSDLRAMAASLPAAQREEIMQQLKGEIPRQGDLGPIKTLLITQEFDEVRLLSNYPVAWNKKFAAWLGVKAEVVAVDLKKPTDYTMIFRIADAELSAVRHRKDWGETQLCLHLSPGTPAMAAVWLLLGKTRYPATFYETFAGKSSVTEVPFDLTIDVIPEILRNPDSHLQHLASRSPSEVEGFADIVGDTRAIRDAVGRATRAAIRGVTVLLLGESGTGKEMFAHAIHKASSRRVKPFLAINCAALSKTLLESELFGHTKGAYTGADKERKGAFELVDGGTLFLDEVGECDLETQAKLLRNRCTAVTHRRFTESRVDSLSASLQRCIIAPHPTWIALHAMKCNAMHAKLATMQCANSSLAFCPFSKKNSFPSRTGLTKACGGPAQWRRQGTGGGQAAGDSCKGWPPALRCQM